MSTNWLTALVGGLTTTLSTLTPQQLRQFTQGVGQASTSVTQAVESQEMQLLQQIADNPASASAPLASLTAIPGVPAAAVSLASDAIKAFAGGDKTTAAGNISNAKAIILQQKLSSSGIGGLLGGMFG
jgi:hypothetical protein